MYGDKRIYWGVYLDGSYRPVACFLNTEAEAIRVRDILNKNPMAILGEDWNGQTKVTLCVFSHDEELNNTEYGD